MYAPFPPPRVPAAARWLTVVCVVGIQCLLSPLPATAGDIIRIPKVSRAPRLAQFLARQPRDAEAVVQTFRQRLPGDGDAASRATTAYISYDNRNLYVVFDCKDTASRVRANHSPREEILNDDQVAVYLDTFNDRRRAYVFAANPLGIQRDGMFSESQPLSSQTEVEDITFDARFDTLWHSEGSMTADGYVVWMRIPFSSLRFPKTDHQSWGIVLVRTILGNNEESCWPYVTNRVAGFLQQAGRLEGLDSISPGRNLQFIPYSSFTSSKYLETNGAKYVASSSPQLGLDSKVVVRDAFTLDVTLNPDFSQVESDDPQLTVNERFEVMFPEKRPFFLENAGYFETPINLFFSRRVRNPDWGARFTGKSGLWAVGLLATRDGQPRPDGIAEPGGHADIMVLRASRDLREQSQLGILVSTRGFGPERNTVVSLDGRIKAGRTWFFDAQLARSYDHGPSSYMASGSALWSSMQRRGRNLTLSTNYLDVSADFRADVGFVPRVGIRQSESELNYRWRQAESVVPAFGPGAAYSITWDSAGQVQDWVADAFFTTELRGRTEIVAGRQEWSERFRGTSFRTSQSYVLLQSEWWKWLAASASYQKGTAVNFYPARRVNPFRGAAEEASLSLAFRLRNRIRLDNFYYFRGLRTGSSGGPPDGTAVFNNHLLRAKLNCQITRALSVRTIWDYSSVLPNPSLVALDRSKQLRAEALLTFLLNPGTALYAGYSNLHENLALRGFPTANIRRTASPTTMTDRLVYVKISYLIRF